MFSVTMICANGQAERTSQVVLSGNGSARADFRQNASNSPNLPVLITHNPLDELADVTSVLIDPLVDLASASSLSVLHVIVIGHGMAELLSPIFLCAGHDSGQDTAVSQGHADVGDGGNVVVVVVEGVVQSCLGKKQQVLLGDVDQRVQHRGPGGVKASGAQHVYDGHAQ
jgi:hypothetical protein